jgi:hypothetical protein
MAQRFNEWLNNAKKKNLGQEAKLAARDTIASLGQGAVNAFRDIGVVGLGAAKAARKDTTLSQGIEQANRALPRASFGDRALQDSVSRGIISQPFAGNFQTAADIAGGIALPGFGKVGAIEKVASPLARLGAYSALRGVEGAAMNSISTLSQTADPKLALDSARQGFLFGAGGNVLGSPLLLKRGIEHAGGQVRLGKSLPLLNKSVAGEGVIAFSGDRNRAGRFSKKGQMQTTVPTETLDNAAAYSRLSGVKKLDPRFQETIPTGQTRFLPSPSGAGTASVKMSPQMEDFVRRNSFMTERPGAASPAPRTAPVEVPTPKPVDDLKVHKYWENDDLNAAYGGAAGIEMEKQEDGSYKVGFDPAKAAAGVAVMGGVKRLKGKQAPTLAKTSALNSEGIPVSGLAKIGSAGESPVKSTRQRLDKLYSEVINRYQPLEDLAKKGGKDEAMRRALAGHYGAGSTSTYHLDFELSPLFDRVDVDDLKAYTIAQRDMELAERGIKGSDALEAEDALSALSKKYQGDLSNLEETAQKLYAYQDKLVQEYLVKTGVLSEEAYTAMRAKNQRYIPFKRVMDEVDDMLGVPPTGKAVASVGSQNVIQKIKGSDRAIVDPLQSIVENTHKIVALGKRNAVARTLVSLKDSLPEGMIQKFDGEVGSKPVISVLENGKKTQYLVPEEVAQAAKGMNEDQVSAIVKIFAKPTEWFRATATSNNPEFLLPNVFRDAISAFLNTGATPLDTARGLKHLAKKDEVYRDFLKSGGRTSRISLDKKSLRETVDDVAYVTIINSPKKLWQMFSDASEQPTRIGIFERTLNRELKKGTDPQVARELAAAASQEGTTNFARKGSAMTSVNMMYAFLNARVQGIDQMRRSFQKDPAGFSTRMAFLVGAPSIALYLHNRQDPAYFDENVVPQYEKDQNFIIMAPWLGEGRYIKIPKGDVGKLANPLEAAFSQMDGQGGDVQAQLLSALKAFSPVDNMGDVIPTALRPIVENAANKNFFTNRDIVPDYKQDYPARKQDTKNTAPLYRMIGDTVNQSPARIENLARGYLTGAARLGEMATAPSLKEYSTEANEQGDPINRTPIVRRFVGGAKKSEEEAALASEKQAKSIQFRVNDIKSGVRRGELTPEEGAYQIDQLMGEQPTASAPKGGLSASASAGSDLELSRAKFDVQNGRAERVQVGDTVILADPSKESGYRTVDLKKLAEQVDTKKRSMDLAAAKETGDYPTWENLQKDRYNALEEEKKSLHPEFDILRLLEIEETQGTIVGQVQKYRSYGGAFKKPKAPKKLKVPKVPKASSPRLGSVGSTATKRIRLSTNTARSAGKPRAPRIKNLSHGR